jgi:hypothetical protein
VAKVAVDNDVVAKCAAYSLLCYIAGTLDVNCADLGVLGTVIYVIKARHLKTAGVGGEAARQQLREFYTKVKILEPTDEESQLAARLEQVALELSLQFDVGESQLCAIVVSREIEIFCTGDKRAIRAIGQLVDALSEIEHLLQRILPFEGLVRRMVASVGYPGLRANICSSPGTDKSVEICFQCHREDGTEAEAVMGLNSYLGALARESSRVIIA